MLLNFKSPSRSLAIQKQAHTIRLPKNQDWKEFKVGKVPMAANVKLTNIYSDVVKDGQREGRGTRYHKSLFRRRGFTRDYFLEKCP